MNEQERCMFKEKPCPNQIQTIEDGQVVEGTTWWYLRRLSNLGNSEIYLDRDVDFKEVDHIDTMGHAIVQTFKQHTPRYVAKLYSEKKIGPFTTHPCSNCTTKVVRDLNELGLLAEQI